MSTKLQPQKTTRKASLSNNKMLSQLSMSFYDESTARRQKQVILDSCPFELDGRLTLSQMLTEKEKPVKSTSKLKKKQPDLLFESEKDETDFRTTQDSKMISR